LAQRREADLTKARIKAHKTHIMQGHPTKFLMKQEIDAEVEKAAKLEIDEEKQKQERIRLQDQQNIVTNLRRESYQKGVQVRQLTAENKLLEADHKTGFEKNVTAQHASIAKRDLEISQRQDLSRLHKENAERQRKIQEDEARIAYMGTEEYQSRKQLSAAVALENQVLQQREIDQKKLTDQLDANQVLNTTKNIAEYARTKNIPLESVMDNIAPHLDEIELSGKSKVEAVRQANERIANGEREYERRYAIVDEILAHKLSDEAYTRIDAEVESAFVETYGENALLMDYFRDYPTFTPEKFEHTTQVYRSAIARQKKL
jgi:hypothetical protein